MFVTAFLIRQLFVSRTVTSLLFPLRLTQQLLRAVSSCFVVQTVLTSGQTVCQQNKHDTWHQHHFTSGRVTLPFGDECLKTCAVQDRAFTRGLSLSLQSPHASLRVTYRTFQNTKRFQKRTNNNEDTFVYVRCQNGLFKVWKYQYRLILIRS